jgi:hypothetical protein
MLFAGAAGSGTQKFDLQSDVNVHAVPTTPVPGAFMPG